MASQFDELDQLLQEWELGLLDEKGIARVREILKSDPAARQHYVQMQMLDAALQLEQQSGLTTSITPAEEAGDDWAGSESISKDSPAVGVKLVRQSTHMSRAVVWFSAAAALLVCVLGGRLAYLEFDRSQSQPQTAESVDADITQIDTEEETSTGIALVTRLVDAVWEDDQRPLAVGDALLPGRLGLAAGYMQVEFFCGATVILEGPAELDLESSMLARVHRGRLRAQVPPAARGFTIDVADMKVVDLGTEFGISVSDFGADVQVFDGEVELHQPTSETRLLTAGQAIVRNATGAYDDSEVTPESFVDIATLESRVRGQQNKRFENWKAWSNKVRTDPRVIAYYACDQQGGWGRRLMSSVEPVSSEADGAIVGARRVQGRWPSKGGLEFKRPGDRVRVQIPGEYGSLTLACWVKIDSLDRMYNSLFLTDSYEKGEPHWQILDTGQLFFSVRPRGDDEPNGIDNRGPGHRPVISPPFWEPSMSGQWLHLATTYDVEAQTTTHFLNGEELYTEEIPDDQMISTTRVGIASIGNWSEPTKPDAKFAIRNLNGSIDEFVMFSASLAADEIKEMYENGKP